MKKRIGILGSTGYTGVVLTRYLLNHPNIDLVYLASDTYVDKKYSDVYPAFLDELNKKCKPVNLKNIANECDLVFFATPHNFSSMAIPKLLKENNKIKIIDLSADCRLLENLSLGKRKFKIVYGLPEIYRKEIKSADIVANPGCYPTSVLLALAPAIKNKLIKLSSIIIDSKSGVTGAGKQPKPNLHFCEVNEGFSAYAIGGEHRHIPEIENELSKLGKKKIQVSFTPHLLPINRGILSTIYVDLVDNISLEKAHSIFKDFYKNDPFVKILPAGVSANIKNVRYTNLSHISIDIDKRLKKLILVSVIDNMVKGASGQAIQNMNIMFSWKENIGLDSVSQIL